MKPPGDPNPGMIIEWLDSVRLNGRRYEALRPDVQPLGVLQATDLGEVLDTVCTTLAAQDWASEPPPRDRDATYLSVGTELRSFPGVNPLLRFGALDRGRVKIYEAYYVCLDATPPPNVPASSQTATSWQPRFVSLPRGGW